MFGLTAAGNAQQVVRVGSTPTGVYRELIRMHREEGLDFIPLPLKHEFDFGSARRLAKVFDERAVGAHKNRQTPPARERTRPPTFHPARRAPSGGAVW